MTVSSQTSKETFDGNGVTTIWDLPFRFFDNADIFAYQVDPVALVTTPLTLGIDYSLYGAGLPEQFGTAPGKITTTVPIPNGKQLYVERIMAIEQLTDIVNQGRFFPEVHEDVFDHLTMLIQQSDASNKGAIRVAFTDPEPNRLPPAGARANLLMGFDSAGNPTAVAPVSGSTSDLALMLANNTNPFQGAAMIGYRGRDVRAKLDENLTIDDYAGADDSARFDAMIAATSGLVRFGAKPVYNIGNKSITTYPLVTIVGKGRPNKTSDLGKLQGGTVVTGSIAIRADTAIVGKFGIDQGVDRGIAGADGLVINSPTGQDGACAIVDDFAFLGESTTNNKHGVLVQGFNSGWIRTPYTGRVQFGVVTKSRNIKIIEPEADACRTAAVYPKGDLPAFAGDVGSGVCAGIQVIGGRHTAAAGNTEASGVYCHASTDACSDIQIFGYSQTGGAQPLRVQGSGLISDPAISGIQAFGISSNRAQLGCFMDGYAYDVQVTDLRATNPATGQTVSIGSNVQGWKLNGAHSVITDGAIVGTTMASLNGIGTWSDFSARGGAGVMTINVPFGSLGTIAGGNFSGNCRNSQDVNLTGINGAVNVDARMRVQPGKLIKLAGSFSGTLSNKAFCNIGSTGKQQGFSCLAIVSGSYVTIGVRLNDFQLTVEPSIPAGLTQIFLDGISIQL